MSDDHEELWAVLETERVERAKLQAMFDEGKVRRLQTALEEAIALAEEGWGYASPYFRDKWSCEEKFQDLRKRAGVTPDEPLPRDEGESWHYRRTCVDCGHMWWGLHCPHDGAQNPCPACGKRPETITTTPDRSPDR